MNKLKFYQQLKEEEKELLETLKALQILISRYEVENHDGGNLSNDNVSQVHVTANYPREEVQLTEFDPNMSISKKLMYVLKVLTKATSREVAEKAYQLDQTRTKEQWVDDSRFYLSKYYNEKKLIVVKGEPHQRGNVYSFPAA